MTYEKRKNMIKSPRRKEKENNFPEFLSFLKKKMSILEPFSLLSFSLPSFEKRLFSPAAAVALFALPLHLFPPSPAPQVTHTTKSPAHFFSAPGRAHQSIALARPSRFSGQSLAVS
jgi:hypothetical protein